MSSDGSTGGGQASTGGGSTGGGGSSAASFMGWGDNWRHGMAAGSTDSEKELAQLQRYESPEQIWKKARELEKRMSSGELRSALKKDAPPEEVAKWRAENGIPATPGDYKVLLPDGKKPPAEDDAFIASFRKSAHESNYTQSQMDQAVKTFYAEVDRQASELSAAETKAVAAGDVKLRELWGKDYELNKGLAENLLSRAPAGFRDRFMNGYLEDRTPIKASPEAWQWLARMEREIDPTATVVPQGSANVGQAVDAELKELRALMGNKQSAYWKGPDAEAKQERYRQLIAAQGKMKAKAA